MHARFSRSASCSCMKQTVRARTHRHPRGSNQLLFFSFFVWKIKGSKQQLRLSFLCRVVLHRPPAVVPFPDPFDRHHRLDEFPIESHHALRTSATHHLFCSFALKKTHGSIGWNEATSGLIMCTSRARVELRRVRSVTEVASKVYMQIQPTPGQESPQYVCSVRAPMPVCRSLSVRACTVTTHARTGSTRRTDRQSAGQTGTPRIELARPGRAAGTNK